MRSCADVNMYVGTRSTPVSSDADFFLGLSKTKIRSELSELLTSTCARAVVSASAQVVLHEPMRPVASTAPGLSVVGSVSRRRRSVLVRVASELELVLGRLCELGARALVDDSLQQLGTELLVGAVT